MKESKNRGQDGDVEADGLEASENHNIACRWRPLRPALVKLQMIVVKGCDCP